MATVGQIADLRELVAEPDDTNGWTDVKLADAIDDNGGDLNAAASEVWLQKATTYATLVDVTESGSSRKMSDLQKNALALSERFAGMVAVVDVSTRPRTRAITRP